MESVKIAHRVSLEGVNPNSTFLSSVFRKSVRLIQATTKMDLAEDAHLAKFHQPTLII
jgi:hypothetical protein